MGNATIRRMNIEDSEMVTDVLINTWETAYRGIVSDDCLDNLDREALSERRKTQYKDYIVACLDDKIVGYCWYVNDNSFSQEAPDVDCEIVALYVLPELKRKGIGRELFAYALDDLKRQGRKKMVIWCLKENYPARKFYEQMGGVIMGEHKTHIGNQDYDEVGFSYSLKDDIISKDN